MAQVRPPARTLLQGEGPRIWRCGPGHGWVVDFAEISRELGHIHAALDHRFLNEIDGLDNPTSESLACWIWERLATALPGLSRVTVSETCTSGCSYEGDR